VLAATWERSQSSLANKGGVFMSTDNGNTFTRISGNGTSGLPNGGVTSLIADPSNPSRFYAGVPGAPTTFSWPGHWGGEPGPTEPCPQPQA
jgi:hypothetical protein